MDTIWDDFESCLKDMKDSECIEVCKHYSYFVEDGNCVCKECGEVFSRIFDLCEWNFYKSDDGGFQQNTQRGDLYITQNPYEKLGSIPGINKNSFMMRMNYQQTFSHKQKVYQEITEKFESPKKQNPSIGCSIKWLD